MATYEQLPGNMNISANVGDDISIPLLFDIPLTGYTFTATILLEQSGVTKQQAITVTPTNLAGGIITLSLTDAQTTAMGELNKRPWYLVGTVGGVTRTWLSGLFSLNRR